MIPVGEASKASDNPRFVGFVFSVTSMQQAAPGPFKNKIPPVVTVGII
jgi:hypothetical protein